MIKRISYAAIIFMALIYMILRRMELIERFDQYIYMALILANIILLIDVFNRFRKSR